MKSKWKYKQVCGQYGNPMANSNGVILEHRFIMSKKIGRFLEKDEIVHHINGDRTDNSPENLRLMNRKDHNKLHGELVKSFTYEVCSYCGKTFKRETRNIKFKKESGQKNFYCNRTCMGKHQKNAKKNKVPI